MFCSKCIVSKLRRSASRNAVCLNFCNRIMSWAFVLISLLSSTVGSISYLDIIRQDGRTNEIPQITVPINRNRYSNQGKHKFHLYCNLNPWSILDYISRRAVKTRYEYICARNDDTSFNTRVWIACIKIVAIHIKLICEFIFFNSRRHWLVRIFKHEIFQYKMHCEATN